MEFDMKRFFPNNIISGRYKKSYPLLVNCFDSVYWLRYVTQVSNQTSRIVGRRTHELFLPRKIALDSFSFEAIGLLQGEMSKTYRNHLTFCNSQPELINLVLKFFDMKLHTKPKIWKWYIKLNIPSQEKSKGHDFLVDYWLLNTSISPNMNYPQFLSFVESTKNRVLKNNGTLVLEKTGRIFVQVIQKLVKDITHSMPYKSKEEIIPFLRGVIAAEACINFRPFSNHRRVFITAVDDKERGIFIQCLQKLGIEPQDCKPIKDIVISRRENLEKLYLFELMTLNPDKYERFVEMLKSYR